MQRNNTCIASEVHLSAIDFALHLTCDSLENKEISNVIHSKKHKKQSTMRAPTNYNFIYPMRSLQFSSGDL